MSRGAFAAPAVLAACAAPSASRGTRPAMTGSISELDYFVGRWHAEATNPETGKTFELDYRVEPALAGRWYFGTGHAAALGLEIHDVWGKDPVTDERHHARARDHHP